MGVNFIASISLSLSLLSLFSLIEYWTNTKIINEIWMNFVT